MEIFMNFIEVLYSTPLVFYSIPFTVLFFLVILSVVGIPLDFEVEFDFFDSMSIFGLSKNKNCKFPFTIILFLFFLSSTFLTLLFIDNITDDVLWVSLYMVGAIYPSLWFAFLPIILGMGKSVATDVGVNYIDEVVEVSSPEVTDKYGNAYWRKNGIENKILIYSDSEDSFEKGEKVLVISYNEKKERYLVSKL